jgi:alcohol/geraniol dehydrogenase (NADP+)
VTAFTSSPDKQQEALQLGAHTTLDSRSKDALKAAAGSFDLILSTVNVSLEWDRYISCLKPKGRLHFVGALLEPVQLNIFSLMLAQRSLSSSPVGSPTTIATMLDFAVRHTIQPQIELFDMKDVNQAIERLRHGSPRYRVVLKNTGV